MKTENVSKSMLRRLPMYLDYLKGLPDEDCNISATAIANSLGLGDVQVRKDLARISTRGRRRTGRSKEQLIRDIEQCVGADLTRSVIVGAGMLGQALLDYGDAEASGLDVMACFDWNPLARETENGKPIYSMNTLESFCRGNEVRLGIIAVPAERAQDVCDGLVACGIEAIWNFAPIHLKVPKGVLLHTENFAVSISSLRMQLRGMEL